VSARLSTRIRINPVEIQFLTGDATEPQLGDGLNIIIHVVNDVGVMGAGIARTIREKWPHVNAKYEELFQKPAKERATAQGQIQIVPVGDRLFVCNLFGQSGIGDLYGLPAVRYSAIAEGLLRLGSRLETYRRKTKDKSLPRLHMPRIGCGLAGGSWAKVEAEIYYALGTEQLEVYVYDFPGPGGTFNP
jgi:O-acetyl-ADP-ribose deacetylase (regulator of RNase III)